MNRQKKDYNIGDQQEVLQTEAFKPFGPMEAIRTHALNVVDVMESEDKAFFKNEIRSLVSREESGFDQRVAEFLLTQEVF